MFDLREYTPLRDLLELRFRVVVPRERVEDRVGWVVGCRLGLRVMSISSLSFDCIVINAAAGSG